MHFSIRFVSVINKEISHILILLKNEEMRPFSDALSTDAFKHFFYENFTFITCLR